MEKIVKQNNPRGTGSRILEFLQKPSPSEYAIGHISMETSPPSCIRIQSSSGLLHNEQSCLIQKQVGFNIDIDVKPPFLSKFLDYQSSPLFLTFIYNNKAIYKVFSRLNSDGSYLSLFPSTHNVSHCWYYHRSILKNEAYLRKL